MRSLLHHRWWKRMIGLGLLAALAFVGHPLFSSQVASSTSNPVAQAWEKARAAGAYHFDSEITQLTIPLPTLTNVGRTSRSEQLYLSGQTDLHANRLEMQLLTGSGSLLQAQSGTAIKIEDGKSYIRQATGDWQPSDAITLDSYAPQGDFMAFLQAVRNVQAHAPEVRGSADQRITFSRYTFQIDSQRLADALHAQMEAAMHASGELPPTMHLGGSPVLRDMRGNGELWVGADGLPLRQLLHLQFPAQRDDRVEVQMVVDFSRFGTPEPTLYNLVRAGDLAGIGARLAATLPSGQPILATLPLLALAVLIVYYRKRRLLERALATAVISSMVIGPLLTVGAQVRFFDVQRAKAATQEEQQARASEDREIRDILGTVEFNPQLNPLEAVGEGQETGDRRHETGDTRQESGDRDVESSLPSPVSGLAAATLAQSTTSVALPRGAFNWWAGNGNANDLLSGDDKGVLNGSVSFAQGQVGQAFAFDGGNGYVALPDNIFSFPATNGLNSPTSFSFELWFKTAASGVILGQQEGTVAPYAATPVGYVPAIYVGTDGRLRVQLFWGGAINPTTSAGAVNNNTFRHLAVVYNGTTQTVYLDGVSIGSRALTQTPYNTAYKYQLGTGFATNWPSAAAGWSNFNGLIDEPTLYTRSLTLAEVQSIFNAGSGGKSLAKSDRDGDSLTDLQEMSIGTSAVMTDTDSDGLRDNVEVAGFTLGGQKWYLNPSAVDSNKDGQGDGIEWGLNPTGTLRATPLDSDSDNLPDLFDEDNDGDGVPDNQDLSPFSKGGFTYTESDPLQIKLNNLTAGKPAIVEFQLRPQDPNHLQFAQNVLDWPFDDQGQMQDIDHKTFADVATASGRAPSANEANGDLKLVPMLELRIPTAPSGLPANLPTQAELTPYNISVNNQTADGANKTVYVPLSLLTDEKSGLRVAFGGQMRYAPTGVWPNFHSVRLVWVVQALVDQVTTQCDAKANPPITTNCTEDGYIHNLQQPIQSYYDNFTLTGLTVREDHGATMNLIYEDPAVDPDKKDDAALWSLAYVLDHHFAIARDDNRDGQRDVTVETIAQRFDRTTNGAVSEADRFGVPNVLRVVKNSYPLLDQALAATVMTETKKLLDSAFTGAVTADAGVKPLIMFAQESSSRLLTLDALTTGGNYVLQTGPLLALDMAPAGQPAQTVSVVAGLKWAAYCPSAAPITWAPCDANSYWQVLAQRYLNNDPDPVVAQGRLQWTQLFYSGFQAGSSSVVQEGASIPVPAVNLHNAATTTQLVTLAKTSNAAVLFTATNLVSRTLGATLTTYFLAARIGDVGTGGSYLKFGAIMYRKLQAEISGKVSQNLSKGARIDTVRLRSFLVRYALAPLAVAGAVLTIAGSILEYIPQVSKTNRQIVNLVSASLNFALTVVLPTVELSLRVNAIKALTTLSLIKGTAAKLATAGLVLTIAATFAFFIYAAVTSGAGAGSVEVNRLFYNAVASIYVALLLFVVSTNPVGFIITAVLAGIDLLLTIICEAGVSALRDVPGAGSGCFTLTGTATKYVAYFLYNYDLMIDVGSPDLIVTGPPQVKPKDATKGLVAGNPLAVSMAITSTVKHKNPDPANGLYIYPYLWLYSPDNLRSSTVKLSLTPITQTVQAGWNQMNSRWAVREDHKLLLTPMYRGQVTGQYTLTQPFTPTTGLNQSIPLVLNMGYGVPAYECFAIPNIIIPFVPPVIPICSTREAKGNNSSTLGSLVYDIFPPTLDGFMALGTLPNGSQRLAWDTRFPAVKDADGDSLLAGSSGGIDPNDATPDSDKDGLSDLTELQWRQLGQPVSPVLCDSDNDGLSDAQEVQFGADPTKRDSDGDLLADGDEAWHAVINTATCQPTGAWSGGWDLTIPGTTAVTLRVSSDPAAADSDGDGIDDLAEKQLGTHSNATVRVDIQGVTYNPLVANTPPIQVLTDVSVPGRFVKPGQSFRYTTTMVANVPLAPSLLDVMPAAQLGAAPLPSVIVQNVPAATALTVPTTAATAVGVPITSRIRARLAAAAPSWSFDPLTVQTLGTFAAPNLARYTSAAANRSDRLDSYRLLTLNQSGAPNTTDPGNNSTLATFALPSGQNQNLATLSTYNPATVACNNRNDCLAIWDTMPTLLAPPAIAGVMVGADGTVKSNLTFANRETGMPAILIIQRRRPVVASNGDGFLVIYQADLVGINQTTRIGIQAFNKDGLLVGSNVIDTGLPVVSSRTQLQSDLAWLGDRYRLVYKATPATAITRVDLNSSGIPLGSSAVLVNDSATSPLGDVTVDYSPRLAYDPVSGRWLLAYVRGATAEGVALLYTGVNSSTPAATRTLGTARKQVRIAYQPQSSSWLATLHNSTNDLDAYTLSGASLSDLAAAQRFNSAGNSIPGSVLACPAPSAVPSANLRFEELPVATTFLDSSGRGNRATCSGAACPAAGVAGAVNAQNNPVGTPSSDNAVQFDGVDDALTISRTLTSDFSIAVWLKSAPGVNNSSIVIDQGANLANGWTLWLGNGRASFLVGANGVFQTPTRIDDNQWHFVVATRDQASGIAKLYLDGTAVNTTTFASGLLTGVTNLRIGGDRSNARRYTGQIDNLQLFNTILGADTVQQLYGNAQPAYCVAARANASGAALEWARLNTQAVDNRGGKIVASGGVTLTIDADPPTSTITSLVNNQYLRGSTGAPVVHIVAGSAGDRHSGVANVQVSVNGGAAQLADGANSWLYSLPVTEGQYTLKATAIDGLGNVQSVATQPQITLFADGSAPRLIDFIPDSAVLPLRSDRGQPKQPWRLTIYGSAADPTLPSGLPGSGVQSVAVLLTDAASGIDKGWQNADLRALAWSVGYVFPSEQTNPTGIYTVTMQFTDKVGNVSVATRTIRVDVDGPRGVMTQSNVATGVFTNTITSAVTVGGVISDTGSAGLDKAELFITPLTRTLLFSDTLFWLPFDDRAGLNDFTDRTLYQSDGACAICGTVSTIDDGKTGQGLYVTDASSLVPIRGEFDPTVDQYFSNPQQSFSMQVWLKSSDTRPGSQLLFYKPNFPLSLYLQDGRANFRIGTTTIPQVAGTSDLRDNQWHHLVATVDRVTGQISLYVDGRLIESKPFAQTLVGSPFRYHIGTGYVGLLDEVMVLGHALSASEVQALYRTPDHYPVTLAQRGAGILRSNWTLPLPAGLEGLYQFDLYGRDMQGNRLQSNDIWRGLIDTVAPRVTLSGRATGQSYLDTATNTQRYEIAYTCRAADFQLAETTFDCAGNSQRPPSRSFNNDPLLKQRFPDLTLLTTLVNTYTVWAASPTPTGSLTACDAYNHCTTVNATAATGAVAGVASGAVNSETVSSAAVTAGPQTTILAPAAGSVVNSTGAVQVSVAAQADQSLKELVILLDNTPVSTIAFAQQDAVKRTVQTAAVTVATAGTHTLAVRATDWSGAQSQLISISFVADRQAPVVALSNSQLTRQDSYGAQTNILRFRGTASDDTGLVAVQVKVGDAAYADATFGGGNWQLAYPVTDPEGKQLSVKVRARDAAGNLTEISQTLGTDLSVADAPDTTLGDKPADPSSGTSASFTFSGSATAVAFECQLDDAPAVPCASPWLLSDLSNGSHTLKVAALNAQGFADLTPASHTWTVNVTTLAATLTAQPEAVTTSRTASFSFTANGASSFECALDGGKYSACASPKSYEKLGNGNHTFLVRAKAGATNGPATRYAWRVNNAAPTVTGDQVAMVVENGAVNVTLQGADSDPLTYQIVEQPQHGLLLGLAPNLTYVPNTGYAGPDRFTYRAWDGEAASAPATVHITVRLGKYAVFAQEGVAFEQNSLVVRGDVGVNVKSAGPFLRNNVEASFSQNAKLQDPASRVLADSIVVDNNGVIYNPSYNDLTGKGVVNGVRTTPLALPLRSGLPALPTITAGTQAVTVNGSQTLAAGSYGALTVNNGATLVLSGGLYHFASWTVSQNAKVHFQASSEVRIAGALVVNQSVFIGPAPGVANLDANSIVIHIAGTDGQSGPGNQPRSAAFDQNVVVTAYVVAPNGMINFRQNVNATGVFIGKWVLAEQNAKVTRPGDPVVRAASTESAGGETVVITPTESILSEGAPMVVVTTSTTLPVNTLFLPLVKAGIVDGSEAADSGAESHEPANRETVGVEVTPVVTGTLTLTTTAVMTATPLLSPTVALTLTTVGTPTVTAPINGAETTPVGTTGYQVFLPSVNR